MKAHLRSARIAPKKANIIAKMVRGMPVPHALEALRATHKKGARMVEGLLLSAVANAQHNEQQDPAQLTIKTIVVNQGTGYRRGVPMSRGRIRPMIKLLSHISLTLGVADVSSVTQKPVVRAKKTSPIKKNEVQKKPSKTKRSSAASSMPLSASTPS